MSTIIENMKCCDGPLCNGMWKDISEFSPNKLSYDGYENKCRICKKFKRRTCNRNCVNCLTYLRSYNPVCDYCIHLVVRRCPGCMEVKSNFQKNRTAYQFLCTECRTGKMHTDKKIFKEMAAFYAENLLKD